MNIVTIMNKFILTDSQIIPVLGSKLFPNEATNCFDPYIVYDTQGPNFIDHLNGVCDLEHMNFTYNCYAMDKQQALSLADRVLRIFARDTFVITRGKYEQTPDTIGVEIQCTKSEMGFGQSLNPDWSSNQPQFLYPVDIEVWYKTYVVST